MILRCFIVDDEISGVNVLSDYITREGSLSLKGFSTDPQQALNSFRENGCPQVVFLDIDMPVISGLQMADAIAGISPETRIVFCTSFKDFAVDAYDKEVFDYLLKPVSYERFTKCVSKVVASFVKDAPAILIHAGSRGSLVKVNTREIVYIKGLLNYVEIYTVADKYITYLSMDEVLSKLPECSFSRVHRSYIVNHDFIANMKTDRIFLRGSLEIPIGRVFKRGFMEKVKSTKS